MVIAFDKCVLKVSDFNPIVFLYQNILWADAAMTHGLLVDAFDETYDLLYNFVNFFIIFQRCFIVNLFEIIHVVLQGLQFLYLFCNHVELEGAVGLSTEGHAQMHLDVRMPDIFYHLYLQEKLRNLKSVMDRPRF